ncbi:TDT family transporter [Rossellomorea vietnamensis]|uniref:hypothetical protein n=1 Tax=Rossellomorea vietnamensis TaxID=218284 RepID=UPI001E35079E|nr:hypothetical protein [Rossellomorea vietnamensis]MCC5800998.1 hypothetical protein [Rossellomorea vietnamensis]
MKTEENKNRIDPASGAIVMALGIFLYASIEAFTWVNHTTEKILSVSLIVLTAIIYKSLIKQLLTKSDRSLLLSKPVPSFVIGSWVAGISVLSNVVVKYFPDMIVAVQVLMLLNTMMWLGFMASCVYQFKELMKRPAAHSTHGVVLLSTVATQSVVIFWVKLYPSLPEGLLVGTISLGIFFYLIGLTLMIVRYGSGNRWTLMDDWPSTNCIIHGALSITGLAIVSSGMLSGRVMMVFWLVVFILLIGVESLEMVRAATRVQKLGWKKGIFTYHISQWSRNFTFGMFYAFTMTMHDNPHYLNRFYPFHEEFLHVWAWIVCLFLLAEIGLWVGSNRYLLERKSKERVS